MKLINYELNIPPAKEREDLVIDLWKDRTKPALVLNTCQRLECFGFDEPEVDTGQVESKREHVDAFERLARIATGLESRILGELEVLGQVRNAYKYFHSNVSRDDKKLDRIFQDAIALARKARRESGIDKNLTSLGALASRELISAVAPGEPVAVIGAGSIAGSVARYLGKRGQSPVRVSSRCSDRAMTLATEVGGFGASLNDLAHLLEDVTGIITATAAPHPVLYKHHLAAAKKPLFIIDLGVPPDCCTEVQQSDDVNYISLEEIEMKAHINTDERRERAKIAARIIQDGAREWCEKN